LSHRGARGALARPRSPLSMSPDAYRQQLLAPLRPSEAHGEALPTLPSGVWFRPERRPMPVSLADLYSTGIECGHAETRAYLKIRIGAADADLAHAQARGDRALAELTASRAETIGLRRDMEDRQRVYEQQARDLEGAINLARD